ncbi:MAG: glutathione peroxidase [Pseudomonadota bacterium]
MRGLLCGLVMMLASPAVALNLEEEFSNIDGGTHRLADWSGQPILVVNTASLCGFTRQYDALQALHDRYSDRGLVVLAVPSNNFAQELEDEAAVKEFCEVNYNLTLPMTGITHVKGPNAHPFYKSLAEQGFEPNWNFNKVLIGPDGALVATYRSQVRPTSRRITDEIERLLDRSDS